jgi:hypothetical protein
MRGCLSCEQAQRKGLRLAATRAVRSFTRRKVSRSSDSSVQRFVIIWRFAARRAHLETTERRAQELIAASYFILAAYIAAEATRTLVLGDHAEGSWAGIGLAAFTAPTMPLLARA